jgi:hypothetical protein
MERSAKLSFLIFLQQIILHSFKSSLLKYMPILKNSFLYLSILFFVCPAVAQNTKLFFDFGIHRYSLKSDFEDGIYEKSNKPKVSSWTGVGIEIPLVKRLRLNFNINYQERYPLEVFVFPTGDPVNPSNFEQIWVFAEWPTSPKSKKFEEPLFVRFPNFKYFNLEIIPTYKLSKKIPVEVGMGLFGGYLLNQKQVTIKATKEYFPSTDLFFGPPNYVHGEVKYHKISLGFVPKIGFYVPLMKNKVEVGANFKYYHSLVRMNDNFVESSKKYNVFWKVFLANFSVRYLM